MTQILTIAAILWVLCGSLAASIMVAYYQAINDKYLALDLWFSISLGILGGPFALAAICKAVKEDKLKEESK